LRSYSFRGDYLERVGPFFEASRASAISRLLFVFAHWSGTRSRGHLSKPLWAKRAFTMGRENTAIALAIVSTKEYRAFPDDGWWVFSRHGGEVAAAGMQDFHKGGVDEQAAPKSRVTE
jgi:hypothetical protein